MNSVVTFKEKPDGKPRGPLFMCVMARDNLSRQGDWECPLLRGDNGETPGLWNFSK